MPDTLHCPFCGAELKKEMAGDIETGRLVCCTKNCPCIDQNLFPDVWELLTTGKRAQDALKVATDFIGFVNTSRHADGALAAMAICKLNEITSITKQEANNENS